jgi:hypothetical protein
MGDVRLRLLVWQEGVEFQSGWLTLEIACDDQHFSRQDATLCGIDLDPDNFRRCLFASV